MIKTIVLAGDRNYIRQLETTIKSILYHNRDVKIYILNQDIMPDWFRKPRKIARMLGSEIIDVKLPEQTVFQDWEKQDHISSITYARYFIADYIQEDTVLYLDSDLIVNTSLEKLFSICLEEKSLAAVKDTDGITFNTGVLLINNEKWRQEKLKERLIEQSIVTMKEVEEGRFEHFNGDQTIFNQVLQDDWLELGRAYNLQVGHDIVALYNNWQEHLAFKDMLEKPLDIIQVKGIDETLDYIIEHNSSLVRFGDGEVNLMWGLPIPYQNHDLELANQLKHIVGLESDEKLVVCLPDAFDDRFVFTWWATPFWKEHMNVYMDFYKELCKGSWYGSTFISRPYIDYEDKSKAKGQFEKLKSIWENRDILIVEGITSRSGVGNDLFDKVKSVKRIICPSHNAYSVVDNIQEEIMKHAEGRLILCMLGPTAKVLSYNLCQMGYQVLDVGHIDSEYEWMKMGAKTKVKFSHKHTAEHNFDQDIEFIDDETYNSQILVDLSKREV